MNMAPRNLYKFYKVSGRVRVPESQGCVTPLVHYSRRLKPRQLPGHNFSTGNCWRRRCNWRNWYKRPSSNFPSSILFLNDHLPNIQHKNFAIVVSSHLAFCFSSVIALAKPRLSFHPGKFIICLHDDSIRFPFSVIRGKLMGRGFIWRWKNNWPWAIRCANHFCRIISYRAHSFIISFTVSM